LERVGLRGSNEAGTDPNTIGASREHEGQMGGGHGAPIVAFSP